MREMHSYSWKTAICLFLLLFVFINLSRAEIIAQSDYYSVKLDMSSNLSSKEENIFAFNIISKENTTQETYVLRNRTQEISDICLHHGTLAILGKMHMGEIITVIDLNTLDIDNETTIFCYHPTCSPNNHMVAFIRWIYRFNRPTYSHVIMILDLNKNHDPEMDLQLSGIFYGKKQPYSYGIYPVFPEENAALSTAYIYNDDENEEYQLRSNFLWSKDSSRLLFFICKGNWRNHEDVYLVEISFNNHTSQPEVHRKTIAASGFATSDYSGKIRFGTKRIEWSDNDAVKVFLDERAYWDKKEISIKTP